MADLTSLFNTYSLRARLQPALLTLLPLALMVLALFPYSIESWKALLPLALSSGAVYMLADIARARGKALEVDLISEWGGWPTTIWLRHGSPYLTNGERIRYHAFLAAQPGVGNMPTAADELADPAAADAQYASAASWLRANCRGDKFALVEKELANYGFRRNLLGLKPLGALVLAITVALPGVAAVAQHGGDQGFVVLLANAYSGLTVPAIGAFLFDIVALVVWLVVVNSVWVRASGDQYARALLSCCDGLAAGAHG